MRKIFFLTVASLLLLGCKDKIVSDLNIEIFNSVGIIGKPEYLHFLNSKEGYLFTYITRYKDQTQKELNDPNSLPKTNNLSFIYKTIDGGMSWSKIYSINGYTFYSTALYDDNAIYIKIIDDKDILKNKLLRFDLKTYKSLILEFNFERMGEIWSINEKLFINSKNKNINNIYSINKDFKNMDSLKINRVFKNKVIVLNNKPFTLTWDNQIYDIKDNQILEIPNANKLLYIAKKDLKNLLVVNKVESSIILYSYNIVTNENEYLKQFDRYSIVQGLQSNNKVICGFIGNIKNSFTEYDLFYSLNQGQTWNIQKLKKNEYIRPSCLIDNILYVYSGENQFQKIIFK
jgi:hypothetical protein